MKKILVPFILVIMLTLAVMPAAAYKGPGGDPGDPSGSQGETTGRGPYVPGVTQPNPFGQGTMTAYRQSTPRGVVSLTGIISAIDPDELVITVIVSRANKLAQDYLGENVSILTNETTRFLYKQVQTLPATVIAFGDLVKGNQVSVLGLSDAEGAWTALRVTTGDLMTCITCLP